MRHFTHQDQLTNPIHSTVCRQFLCCLFHSPSLFLFVNPIKRRIFTQIRKMSFQRIRKENNQPKNQQPNQETDQQQQQQQRRTMAKCKVNLLLTFHFVHGICLLVFFAFLCLFFLNFVGSLFILVLCTHFEFCLVVPVVAAEILKCCLGQ